MTTPTGRFAPSPTGPLHFGSLIAAVGSFAQARTAGAPWLVRIDDIDPPREVPGAAEAIIDALARHGLAHDGEIRFQSESRPLHEAAIARLIDAGHAYYCQCSRKALRAAGHADRYPGTCRDLGLDSGAVRVRVPDTPVAVADRWQGNAAFDLDAHPGDYIIHRRDGLIAYQLAVVVDDADQGVTDIVRGIDLYDSTPRQVWLQSLLGLATPRYAHFPIVLGEDGRKLSKQTGARELDAATPSANLIAALAAMDLAPPESVRRAGVAALLDWAQEGYDPGAYAGQHDFGSAETGARGTGSE